MNLPKIILSGLFAAAAGMPAVAQDSTYGYGFLNIPTSSHVFGLGGNNIALIEEDVNLADQNPALIGPELEMQVAVNYMLYMSTGNFAGVRFGMGAGDHSAWAFGVRYLTYSRDITDRWRGGVNFKMIYSGYERYEAFAMAADLGVNYYNDENDLSFSILLKNMGGQVKRFDKRYTPVPFDIQLGYMQGIGTSPFQISITANNLTRWDIPYYDYNDSGDGDLIEEKHSFVSNLFRHLVFGLQYQPSEKFYACLGYNYKTKTDMSSFNSSFLSGFSIGLGFRIRGFSLEAAYAMPHKSASSLMINLGFSIQELMQ